LQLPPFSLVTEQKSKFLTCHYIIAGYIILLFINLAVLQTSIYQYTIVHSDRKDFLKNSFGALAFPKLPRIKKQGKLFEEFLSNFVIFALCGVVGSERTYQRVWDSSQQAKSVR